tara:strand:- start:49 stop:870 length:822 start_codon:yes stop_codon:yes gene_type:complete
VSVAGGLNKMTERRPRTYSTKAIVIGQRDYVDSARIITILSPEFGKREIVARGLLKPKSRLAGHLEPGTYCQLEIAVGRNLDIIREAQTIEMFREARSDLQSLTIFLYALDLADKFSLEDTGGELFNPLLTVIQRIAGGYPHSVSIRSFEFELLDSSGFRPVLDQCIHCGSDVPAEDAVWSPTDGGVVLKQCLDNVQRVSSISSRALKVLRAYQEWDFDQLVTIAVDSSLELELSSVMHDLMKTVLERELKSANLVEEVRWWQVSNDHVTKPN